MPYYKAIFRLKGGSELQAQHGYVPDDFFTAIQNVTAEDLVVTYEDGFILSNQMHEKLNIPGTFTSYVSIGKKASDASPQDPGFVDGLIHFLKTTNHARPLEAHYNYQVFVMEHIEESFDDD